MSLVKKGKKNYKNKQMTKSINDFVFFEDESFGENELKNIFVNYENSVHDIVCNSNESQLIIRSRTVEYISVDRRMAKN